nr:DUF3365 domain-containing protein [Desulfobulbaceae bacterium]
MSKKDGSKHLFSLVSVSIVIVWVASICGSLYWNLHLVTNQTEATALHVAKAYFDKDLALRLWGAKHGGVYAPVSEDNPPNPYLSHVPERDIVTPSGKQLTLVNPAYMIRQMMAEFSNLTGVGGHLTSLKLLNPINKPDPWEEKKLKVFDEGVKEVTSFEVVDGKPVLRLMRPFITQKPCLKCHGHQGYEVGDVRGATSMSIPMAPYRLIESEMRWQLIATHLLILALGLLGIGWGCWLVNRNINRHFALQGKLEKQNEFIHSIFESLSHPFFVIDANTFALEIANSTALGGKLLFGQTCYSLSHHEDEPCCGTHHPCPINLMKETKSSTTVEHVHFDADGNERTVEVHCFPILDENGELSKVVEYAIDITERRAMERDRENLQCQLQQSQKMEAIGTLAAGIAHDFNNILSAVIGYSELGKMNSSEGDKSGKYFVEINNAGLRAGQLIKQILTFSRQGNDSCFPIQIQSIVKEVVKLLKATIPTSIEIRSEIDPQCEQILIMADQTQIHQVLMNLCTNAYHEMRETGGVLTVSLAKKVLEDGDAQLNELDICPGPYLTLSVQDSGPGIDQTIMTKIFEPFFTTKKHGEGTGMGLAVVHGIVKKHMGAIAVDSELGKGTTFTIFLPITQSSMESQPVETVFPIPKGSERILIVDDEGPIVALSKTFLMSLGYEVSATSSSLEALSLYEKNPKNFDLLLTDMAMPHMSGAELVRKVRAIRPNFPVILCTGFSEVINREKAQALGIQEFIMKPIVLTDLAKSIRKVLDGAN